MYWEKAAVNFILLASSFLCFIIIMNNRLSVFIYMVMDKYEVRAMEYVFVGIVATVLLASIASIWTTSIKTTRRISLENLFVLIQWYITMMLGFALIYMVLQLNGHNVFNPSANETANECFSVLQDSLYLSGMTLLSVGYGDVTPMGIGRWIAIIEALLGYIMPAVLVARTMLDRDEANRCN
jgi:potassium channel LctB